MCCPLRPRRLSGRAPFGWAPSSSHSGGGRLAQLPNRLRAFSTHRETYAEGFCKASPAWRCRRSLQQMLLVAFVSQRQSVPWEAVQSRPRGETRRRWWAEVAQPTQVQLYPWNIVLVYSLGDGARALGSTLGTAMPP